MTSSLPESEVLGTLLKKSSVPHFVVSKSTDTIIDANDAATAFYELETSNTDLTFTEFLDSSSRSRWKTIKEQLESNGLRRETLTCDTDATTESIPFGIEHIPLGDVDYLHLFHAHETDGGATTTPNTVSADRDYSPDSRANGTPQPTDKYQILISNVPGVVYRCNFDPEWTMHFISNTIEDISGYSPDDFINNSVRSYSSIIHPEDRNRIQNEIRTKVNENELFEVEYRILDSTDQVHWVLERGQGIRNDEGEVICLEGVILEITERKLAQQELENLVEEKESLVKEIHHRVKNNLQMMISLLDMQSREATSEEAERFLGESAERIRSMALLHEMLYQKEQISEIGLRNYIESVTDYIRRTYDQNKTVKMNLDIDATKMQMDRAIPSGLILNELIANAFEHGNADGSLSEINLTFKTKNGKAHLIVEDDGTGFPEDFEPGSSESLGLKLVESLAGYELNGNLTLENDDGARVSVVFDL